MTSDLERHLTDHGFITRRQALDSGYNDKAIARMTHGGPWITIGPGLYAGPAYAALTPEHQHLVRCRAVATRFGDAVVFSHHTAALLLGIDVWGLNLDAVHVTRLDTGRGRGQAGVKHHVADLADDEIIEVGGLLVTTATRAVWDVAIASGREQALVIADSALHRGLTDEDALVATADAHRHWRGAGRARITLSLADGAAESPGETRSRFLFRDNGLPTPVLQFKIYDEDGVLIARVDFAWPEFRHLGEFDGFSKYGSTNDLAAEKVREDRLRALAWGVTRMIWSQLSPGLRRTLAEDLYAAMKQSQRLYGHAAS